LHDLQRTLGSWLAAQGYGPSLIGRVLTHSSLAATQFYARLALDPVRHALEENAKLMLGNCATPPHRESDLEGSGSPASDPKD
jgi:hypothetical protein